VKSRLRTLSAIPKADCGDKSLIAPVSSWRWRNGVTICGAMERKSIVLIVVLVALLGGALTFSWHVWTSVGAGQSDGGQMNGNGVAALIIGAVATLLVGGGLMALVFYSSRRGYDDAADLKRHLDD
jgi:hypothetical protein